MFVLLAILGSGLTWANGQSTHLWITIDAMAHLPEGDLRELVTDPTLQSALYNGTPIACAFTSQMAMSTPATASWVIPRRPSPGWA